MPGGLRSLYVCYLSLEDPLVQTQVVAYLEGLARGGHTIHLLTFEPELSEDRRQSLAADLERHGITWHSLRYHKRPSLPATVYDALVGAVAATRLVRRHRLDALHARSHVPAATGLIVRRLTGCRLIFDLRGLLAEEYADAGRWRRGGAAYRITTRIQRAALRRADKIVVLTDRVRRHLIEEGSADGAVVIPCCADLDRVQASPEASERLREELGLTGRRAIVYVGKLTAPYMDREMVEFFAAARRRDPTLAFVVLTQAPPASILAELARAGIPDSDFRVTRADATAIGPYLGLADYAVCFCHPTFARIASSPTKIGEYLGGGLPVVSGPDIGDLDEVLRGREVGVIVDSFDGRGYERAVEAIRELTLDPGCRERCRAVAQEVFSLEEVGIPRYDRLYRELAAPTAGAGEQRR